MAIEFLDSKTEEFMIMPCWRLRKIISRLVRKDDLGSGFFDLVRAELEHLAEERPGVPFRLEEIKWVVGGLRDSIRARVKQVVKQAAEISTPIENLDVHISESSARQIFEEMLSGAVKGFHYSKGRLIIVGQAQQAFYQLTPEEYTRGNFQEIIDMAVTARRKFNVARGRKIQAMIRQARMAQTETRLAASSHGEPAAVSLS